MRVREAGGRAFVDAVIGVAPDAAVGQGHAVADSIEHAIQEALPRSDVTIHIEQRESADLRERATGAALSVRRVREVHNVRTVIVDGGRIELSLHVKLPADETLTDAHAIADEVEAAIRGAAPQISSVHVHLEPLASALEGGTVPPPDELESLRAGLQRIAVEVTGRPPLELSLHREPRGMVAFMTIELPGADTLAEAHEAAARIESRAESTLFDLAEVVVHTEPA